MAVNPFCRATHQRGGLFDGEALVIGSFLAVQGRSHWPRLSQQGSNRGEHCRRVGRVDFRDCGYELGGGQIICC